MKIKKIISMRIKIHKRMCYAKNNLNIEVQEVKHEMHEFL